MRVGKRKDETMTDNGESKDTGSVCLEGFCNSQRREKSGMGRWSWGQNEEYCRAPVETRFGMSWGSQSPRQHSSEKDQEKKPPPPQQALKF